MKRELHRKFKQALLALSVTEEKNGRTSLMTGIPTNITSGLNRSTNRSVDIDQMLTQLGQLGRLIDTGERPLIIVAQNALDYALGSTIGVDLQRVIQELGDFYGTENS